MKLREVAFDGLEATELRIGRQRMVVVHQVGPRIAWFGETESLLFWDSSREHGRGAWTLRGGHRLWVTRPGADESEESYAVDDARCEVRRRGTGSAAELVVIAPPDASRIEKSLVIRGARTGWSIEHRLCNRGDMLWAGGAWALTCTRPRRGTRYHIPLDGGPPGWDVVTMVIPRRWGGGHGSRLDDPQLRLTEAGLDIRPRGQEAKRMISAPRGELAMIDPDLGELRKRASYIPGGQYPLATNVACYLAPKRFMVELETMSPMQTLAPGESLQHVETWTLRPVR